MVLDTHSNTRERRWVNIKPSCFEIETSEGTSATGTRYASIILKQRHQSNGPKSMLIIDVTTAPSVVYATLLAQTNTDIGTSISCFLRQRRRLFSKTGDYSVEGMEDVVAVERKGYDDLYNCLSQAGNRRRFTSQMTRLSKMPHGYLLVDSTVSALLKGHPISRLPGYKALDRLLTLCQKKKVPVYFCDRHGPEVCLILLSNVVAAGK